MYDPYDPWGGSMAQMLEQMRQLDQLVRSSSLNQMGTAVNALTAASAHQLGDVFVAPSLLNQADTLAEAFKAASALQLADVYSLPIAEAVKGLVASQSMPYSDALDAWKVQLSVQRRLEEDILARAALADTLAQSPASITFGINDRLLHEQAVLSAAATAVDWAAIDRTIGSVLEAQRTTIAMVSAYSGLGAASIGNLGSLLAALPETDFLAHISLLRGLGRTDSRAWRQPEAPPPDAPAESGEPEPADGRRDFARQSSASLEQLLSERLPELLPVWRGAREAARSRGSDWVRQYCTSQRELLRLAMQRGAPDTEVRKWTSDPRHYSKETPTRKARILFLCARAAVKGLAQFVVLDVDAAIATFGLLHKGVHEIPSTLAPDQVDDLTIRSDNLLLLVALLATEQVH